MRPLSLRECLADSIASGCLVESHIGYHLGFHGGLVRLRSLSHLVEVVKHGAHPKGPVDRLSIPSVHAIARQPERVGIGCL